MKTIFDHPEVCEDNFAQLRSFYNTVHVAVSTLKSLSYEHDLAATDNLRRAVQKLPETVTFRWGEKRVEMLPKKTTLADLDVWLRERVRAKSMTSDQALKNNGSKEVTLRPPFRRQKGRDPPPRNDLNGTEISAVTTTVNVNRETPRAPIACPVCSHAHKVEHCPEFKGLNVDQRAQQAKENNLCFCCLILNEHQARQCSERRSCGVDDCPKHHHPLVHGAAPVFVGAAIAGCISLTVVLQIVPLVETPKGNNVRTYALLDSRSQASLILERFADELGLDSPRDVLTLGTINSKEESKPSRKVSFAVKVTSSDNDGPLYPVSKA